MNITLVLNKSTI